MSKGLGRYAKEATGTLLFTLTGHTYEVTAVDFNPDGSLLATSGDSGIGVYALRVEDLVTLAQSRVTRSLTTEECQKYLHTAIYPPMP